MKHPAIHVHDNGDGTMTVRAMYEPAHVPFTFRASHYQTAAERYLANRWPESNYRKIGWSASATDAIYHFRSEAA